MSTWGTNVSEPPTEMVGRDAVLESTHALLESTRWITVLGPAGVGKSRFLLALAAGVTPRDAPAGAWRCSLSGAKTESEVCARIAAVLPNADPRSLPLDGTALGGLLVEPDGDGPRMVLILDHAEHAVRVLSIWLPRWLAQSPQLRCLVGTRERLGGPGEHVVRLEPLEPADAARLFEQRAEAARGAPLRPEEKELVSALIHRLDRLPLALELAAAQLSVLSAGDLLDSLEQCLVRLASPDRAASRHASLDAALDLSWDLLDAPRREALQSLALFESDLDLDAVRAMLDDLALLAALADRSWLSVRREGEHRYRVSSVVRAYVRSRGEPRAEQLERHAAFVARRSRDLLETWGDRASTIALCRFADDVRAAMDASTGERALQLGVVLARVAIARGPVPDTLARLDAVLEDDPEPSLASVDALLARGRLRARNAQPDASREDYERALQIADALADASAMALAAASLADHLRHHGERERAEQLYRRALERVEDPRARARVTASLAGLVAERGELDDLDEAEALYDQAVRSARAAADAVVEAAALQNLGLLLQERGDLDRAESTYRDALALHVALAHRRFEAIAHLDLAALALERGRPIEAHTEADAAARLAEQAGDRREHAIAQLLMAVALATLDEDAEHAFALAGSSVRRLDEPGLTSAYATHLGHLALARARAGADDALDQARDALAHPTEGDDARLAHRILARALRRAETAEAIVASDGSSIRLASGETIDLSNRAVLRAILGELAAGLRRGEDVSAEALVAAGWGERSMTKAGKNRLHVALATLRKLGLAEHLERCDTRYRLVACRVGASDD